jgi:MFS family permease
MVAYVGQGICFAVLVTRIPALQHEFDLSDGVIGLLVGLVPVIAGVGSVVAGSLVERHGSRAVLRVMGPVVPVSLVVIGIAPDIPVLMVGLVAIGFGLGAVDASMNIAGVRVQDDAGRSLVAGFYATWSFAGFVGALLASAAAGTTMSLGVFFLLVAVVLVPVQLLVGQWLLPGHPTKQVLSSDAATIHWRPVMIVGIALMCVYIADSGASTFGSDYLNKGLGSSESVAALSFAAYAIMTVVGRLIVDRTVDRIGAVPLVRTGGIIAVVAAVALALAPNPAFAIAAFAVLGLGICPAIPLAFVAAASHDKTSSGLAVARVNVFNYVGFVIGAPLIAGVAQGVSWRWAFGVLVPVLLAVPLLAGWFRVAPHQAPDPDGHLLGEAA